MGNRIRKIHTEDYEEFCKLANQGFIGLQADKWLETHVKETSKEDLYGLFKEEELIAGMRTFDFEMNFSSTMIRAGGVGMLVVDMLHKKEKNAYHLMQYFLHLNAEADVNLVMLHPYKVSFYKRMGFGIGTKNYQFSIDPKEFPNNKKKSHLKELDIEERTQILDCYNRVCSRTHGMTRRFPFERELNRPFWFGRVIGYVEEGKVKGYLVYSLKEKELHIHELFFESPSGIREISTFLHNQSDQIDRIILNSNHEDIVHFVGSPESASTPMVDFASTTDQKHFAHVGVGVMYRMVNCSGFFKDLKEKNHRFNARVTLSIKFQIHDDFYPANSAPFILHIQNGKIVEILEHGPFDVKLSMNVAEFSSMVMGVESALSYFKWGLMEISDRDYLQVINALLNTGSKPVMAKAF